MVTVIVVPLLAMVSIWNTEAGYSREIAKIVFDGGPIPIDIDEELSRYMEEMIQAFEKIDTAIDEDDEEIYFELENYLSYEFTDTDKQEIRNLYLFIKY